jgi:predicted RNase H-like HicB family nuclease
MVQETKPRRRTTGRRGGRAAPSCPGLPGCVTQAETQDAALANLKEAVQANVGALEVDNLPVPQEHFDARLVTV